MRMCPVHPYPDLQRQTPERGPGPEEEDSSSAKGRNKVGTRRLRVWNALPTIAICFNNIWTSARASLRRLSTLQTPWKLLRDWWIHGYEGTIPWNRLSRLHPLQSHA
uniref:Uncharacterized protein n=1 Tax=Leersia perrieri TaxID=77586 RepID=A0A0D9XFI8_9ORYZ